MSTLGFDNYVEPLKLYLQKYRESVKGERPLGEEGTSAQQGLQALGNQSFGKLTGKVHNYVWKDKVLGTS